MTQSVRVLDCVRHNHKWASRQRKAHTVRIRQANGRIGRHDPDGLDFPAFNRAKHVDGLVALARFEDV